MRHPIYTGMLLAFAGTAIARGDGQGVLAFVIAALTLWLKLRLRGARDAAAVWRALRSLRAQGPDADSLFSVTGSGSRPSRWTRAPHCSRVALLRLPAELARHDCWLYQYHGPPDTLSRREALGSRL
ncbi:MAG: hypothetical protein ABI233_11620 [Chthoniobacterales bacterium]